MRLLRIVCTVLLLLGAGLAQAGPRRFLAAAQSPEEYVLAKARQHRIVLLGESHWTAHDAELVTRLVPRLPEAGVGALGIEMLRARDQERIDALLAAPEWDERAAMAAMRTARWPYREYLEILHAAWRVNRAGTKFRVLALGPEEDWRKTLIPRGENYETHMADVAARYLAAPGSRVLLYMGLNHAFTRYYQPEFPRRAKDGTLERVDAFMDRTGNILWRRFGEEAFTIALHHPWRCVEGGKLVRCLPLTVDCDASHAAGFDVAGSPYEHAPIPPRFEYGLGHPALRLVDVVDGYIWSRPLDQYRAVELIPLAEFAPDQEALAYVGDNSPFTDEKAQTPAQLEQQWREQQAWLLNARQTRGWGAVKPQCEAER